VGLPQHHWASLSELLTTSITASSVDSEEDNGTWADVDFPGLNYRGLGASSLTKTTTFMRILTLIMGVMTHLENASCVMGRSTK
jgi:hypothetical protein